MKQIYRAKVWTTDTDYITDVESKYDLTTFGDKITEAKPDAVVRIGDLIIRAGDFKAAAIVEEVEA